MKTINPNAAKHLIKVFVTRPGVTFENAKHAQFEFDQAHPGVKYSPVYFYRNFVLHGTVERKAAKVKGFLNSLTAAINVKEAHEQFETQFNTTISYLYFLNLYISVFGKKQKVAKTKKEVKVESVSLAGLSAKQVIALVAEKSGEQITINVKNKSGILKAANGILTRKGYTVA